MKAMDTDIKEARKNSLTGERVDRTCTLARIETERKKRGALRTDKEVG